MKYILTLLAALWLTPAGALGAETSEAAEREADTTTLRVFIFAGQSNMEGADSKVMDISRYPPFAGLDMPQEKVLFSYNIGREEKLTSKGWVALQPLGNLVGPELSFARGVSQEIKAPIAIIKCVAGGLGFEKALQGNVPGNIAIAKFTRSGSQINDWTPQGTEAKDRNLYPQFIAFIQKSIKELQAKGHQVELAGIFYHVGENDMSFGPYRRDAAKWLKSTVATSRRECGRGRKSNF